MGNTCRYECELCQREYEDDDFLLPPYVCPECEHDKDQEPSLPDMDPYDLGIHGRG
jgi:rubredoxin